MKQAKTKNFYDIIILLCAGGAKENKFFTVLEEGGKYLGGPDRMEATVKLYKDPPSGKKPKIIVVGGGVEEGNYEKVDKMRQRLIDAGVLGKDIIRISSKHKTLGNFRATCKVFYEKHLFARLKNKRIGILTNFYHLPRAVRFAIDAFKETLRYINEESSSNNGKKPERIDTINLIPIAAESITKNFSSFALYSEELLKTISDEIKGLCDWENGEYDCQPKEFGKWEGICHKEDIEILEDL